MTGTQGDARRGGTGEDVVERRLRATDCSAQEVQAEADRLWQAIWTDEDLAAKVRELGVDPAALPTKCPFEATQSGEGFGVVETILIGAAGSLLGGMAQTTLWRIWDALMRPRLSARLNVEPETPEDDA